MPSFTAATAIAAPAERVCRRCCAPTPADLDTSLDRVDGSLADGGRIDDPRDRVVASVQSPVATWSRTAASCCAAACRWPVHGARTYALQENAGRTTVTMERAAALLAGLSADPSTCSRPSRVLPGCATPSRARRTPDHRSIGRSTTVSTTSRNGTAEDPWILTTPPARRSSTPGGTRPPTRRRCGYAWGPRRWAYQLRCVEDLHAMLVAHGDWMRSATPTSRRRQAGHRRSAGPLARQPGGRLVRLAQGLPWPLRELRAAGARGARAGRGRAQPAQQPHAGPLTDRRPRGCRRGRGRRGRSPAARARRRSPRAGTG